MQTNEQAIWEAVSDWYKAHGFTEAARFLSHIRDDWRGHDPAALLAQLNGRSTLAIRRPARKTLAPRHRRTLDHYYAQRA